MVGIHRRYEALKIGIENFEKDLRVFFFLLANISQPRAYIKTGDLTQVKKSLI
jgi:hypothetical protein